MPDLLIASATSRVMLTAAGALSVASAGASGSGRVGSVMRVSMPLTTRELAHNAGPRRAGTFPGRSSIVERSVRHALRQDFFAPLAVGAPPRCVTCRPARAG